MDFKGIISRNTVQFIIEKIEKDGKIYLLYDVRWSERATSGPKDRVPGPT